MKMLMMIIMVRWLIEVYKQLWWDYRIRRFRVYLFAVVVTMLCGSLSAVL